MRVLNLHKLNGVIPPNSIYIGNKNSRYNLPKSKYANPFYLEKWSREKKLKHYEEYLLEQIERGIITPYELKSLYGVNLVCFCHPKRCHGDILMKYITKFYFDPNVR